MSESLWPHGLQHARHPCPSLSPRVCSDSCPLSYWCHQNILSYLTLFSSCLQSFPASGSFQVLHISWPERWSFSFSISAMNIQDWFPLGLTGWISLQSNQGRLSRVFFNTTVQKHQFFGTQSFFVVQLSHLYMTTAWLDGPLLAKECLCFLIQCLGWS